MTRTWRHRSSGLSGRVRVDHVSDNGVWVVALERIEGSIFGRIDAGDLFLARWEELR